jgi:hypothetical protein
MSDLEVVKYIKEIVLLYLNAPEEFYTRRSRKPEVLKVKQYATYFSKRHTSLSLVKISEIFEFKHHSSVLKLITKLEGLSLYDKETKEDLKELENIIKFKGLSKNNRVKFDDFYYINMDNFKTIKETENRAILFVGYSSEEIQEMTQTLLEIREHSNTKKYILEPKNNIEND